MATTSAKAWCMSRQGFVWDVFVHPYGAIDDDALEDAAWLWCNDVIPEESGKYLNYYLEQMSADCWDDDIELFVSDLAESVDEIECLRGNTHKSAFQKALIDKAQERHSCNLLSPTIGDANLEKLKNEIKNDLNQNVIRIRYGAEFDTKVRFEGALYFRISSSGYDWYRDILAFIDWFTRSRKVTDITVESDKSSTGVRDIYVDRMPLNEFLMQKPVVMENLK